MASTRSRTDRQDPRRNPPAHALAETLLEVGMAVSFFLALLAILTLAAGAFFTPNLSWHQRLLLMLVRTVIAALACAFSGMFFTAFARGHAEPRATLWRTLPVQLFFWAVPAIGALTALNWYFLCGCPAWQAVHYFACR